MGRIDNNVLAQAVFDFVRAYIKGIIQLCKENEGKKDFDLINSNFAVYDEVFRDALFATLGHTKSSVVIGRRTLTKIVKMQTSILERQKTLQMFRENDERALAYSSVLLHTIVTKVREEWNKNGG